MRTPARVHDPQGPVRPGHHNDAEVRRLEAARRPKPIFGVSSLGGTTHLWASITWRDGARRPGHLGRRRRCRDHAGLAQEQADRRAGQSDALLHTAEKNGWGKLLFYGAERGELEPVYRRPGAGERAFAWPPRSRRTAEGAGLHQRALAGDAMDQGAIARRTSWHGRAATSAGRRRDLPARDRPVKDAVRLQRPDRSGGLRARREGVVPRDRPASSRSPRTTSSTELLPQGASKYPAG